MRHVAWIVVLVACGKGKAEKAQPAPVEHRVAATGSATAPAGAADAGALSDEDAKKLEADVADLVKDVAAIDPVVVLRPCTPADVGEPMEQMEAVDQAAFMDAPPPGSDEAWTWLDTALIDDIVSYRRHAYDKPASLRDRLALTKKILVYVATRHAAAAEGGDAVFEGWIYIYDRETGDASCQLELKATAKSNDAMKYAMGEAITQALTLAGLQDIRPSAP